MKKIPYTWEWYGSGIPPINDPPLVVCECLEESEGGVGSDGHLSFTLPFQEADLGLRACAVCFFSLVALEGIIP